MVASMRSARRSGPRRTGLHRAVLALLACGLLFFLRGTAFAAGKRVLVTGAGGRTGSLVVEKLMKDGRYDVKALVHSEKSKNSLLKKLPDLRPESVFVGEIVDKASIAGAFAGGGAVIIVTSAVPKLKTWSLVPFMLGKLFGKKVKLKFDWAGGKPEQVDWEGQRNQIDCAVESSCNHVVLVGTMTGTQKDSFLNSIGEGDGDKIVMWKRKAELYLVETCKAEDVAYTIIHAGGLSDAEGGKELVSVGVDDKLREKKNLRIAREDIAEACVQALDCDLAKGISFDMTCVDGEGQALAKDGLEDLLKTLNGASCDYSINPPP